MICFPLDNTQYEASALGAWLGTRTRGVFSAEGHYMVTPAQNMCVAVAPGLAWLKAAPYWGVCALEETEQLLQLETAHPALPRVDAICLQLNKNLNTAKLVVKTGEYAQTPAAPLPQRNLNFDEITLATAKVPAGAITLYAENIADERLNEAVCGLMRDGVTSIPTAGLHSAFTAWMQSLRDVLDEDAAGKLLNMITSLQQQAQTIQTTAGTAQTTANAAMPKTGGNFIGTVTGLGANRGIDSHPFRGIHVQTAAQAGVNTDRILFRRK